MDICVNDVLSKKYKLLFWSIFLNHPICWHILVSDYKTNSTMKISDLELAKKIEN